MAVTLFVVPEEEHGIYCFLGDRRPHHKTLRFVTRARPLSLCRDIF